MKKNKESGICHLFNLTFTSNDSVTHSCQYDVYAEYRKENCVCSIFKKILTNTINKANCLHQLSGVESYM